VKRNLLFGFGAGLLLGVVIVSGLWIATESQQVKEEKLMWCVNTASWSVNHLDMIHEGRVNELRALLETTLVVAAEDADKLSEAGVRAPRMILALHPLAARIEQYAEDSGISTKPAVLMRQVADRLEEDSS
jgi:hypothetical protein